MEKHRPAFDRGPYLTAAVLCERVLIEQDGVNSLVRMIDRLTVTAAGQQPPEEMPTSQHHLWLYVSFKSGSARGAKNLTIRIQKPSGDSPPPITLPVNFEGEDDRGTNLVLQMQLDVDVVGVWWFDLSLDDVPVTRLPLRVIYLRQPMPGPGGPTQGGWRA
jgi:hypothetical protein